jgi:hypothetical protein
MKLLKPAMTALLAGVLLSTSGCGSGDAVPRDKDSDIVLSITDAPVDNLLEAVILVSGVELGHSSGRTQTIRYDKPQRVDLVQYQNGNSFLLTQEFTPIETGTYNWIRLTLVLGKDRSDGSYVRFNSGAQYPLYLRSGSEGQLQINQPFKAPQGGTVRLMLDLDLRQSLPPNPDGANYPIHPVLRLADLSAAGTLIVQSEPAAIRSRLKGPAATPEECSPGIYVYPETGIAPDDMDFSSEDGPSPLAAYPLNNPDGLGMVTTRVPFLPTGTYRVTATCDFEADLSDTSQWNGSLPGGGGSAMTWLPLASAPVQHLGTTYLSIPFEGT